MGGVGKTTLAGEIFNKLACQFESSCFLINVREKTESNLVSMKDDLICTLLKEDKLDIGTPSIGDSYIKNRLRCTRVLVVIDDVDDSSQLEILIGGSESVLFGPGSRVIVTSRDKQVLTSYDVARLYDMEILHEDDALHLFSYYAFHQNQPPKPYLEFSKTVVNYARGVALPLKVLGSSLSGKTELRHWESSLRKLKEVPNMKVLDVLKISYDGLNTYEKNMFLDIACFFKGEEIETVTRILDGCYRCAYEGIDVLIDKSLITISQNKKLEMHDLLQEIGWNIVLEESEEPGSRSRLWRYEDVRHVLTRNIGTEKIKGIFFDVSSQVSRINLDSQVFTKMCNLELLKIYDSSIVRRDFGDIDENGRSSVGDNILKVIRGDGQWCKVGFPNGLKSLPDELRYLSWSQWPLNCFPSAFCPDNLVELTMVGGNLEHLWTRPQTLVNLKALRFEGCRKLVEIPDLSSCTNLEELIIEGCNRLVEIPSFIENLTKLKRLDLYCTTKSLSSINHLHKLTYLHLFFCTNLVEIPSSIGNLNYLTNLTLSHCWRLEVISSSIGNLKSLTKLFLFVCNRLVEIPSSIGNLTNLTNLSFHTCDMLVEIPSSIGNLTNLTNLSLRDCDMLVEIPSSIGKIDSLTKLEITCCDSLVEIPSSIGNLTNLINLSLHGCKSLVEIPPSIGKLNRLTSLNMSNCSSLVEIPSTIGNLNNLTNLHLTGCTDLKGLPNGINLASLTYLSMRNCYKITEFPNISTNIKVLSLDMILIKEIPSSLGLLISLENLTLSNCNDDQMSPSFLEKLIHLTPVGCKIEIKPKRPKQDICIFL